MNIPIYVICVCVCYVLMHMTTQPEILRTLMVHPIMKHSYRRKRVGSVVVVVRQDPELSNCKTSLGTIVNILNNVYNY